MEITADNPLASWAFNVIDEFKSLSVEQIREEIKKKSLPFAVAMANLQGDFNFSSVIRNANAFGAKEVFYFGKKRFDKRGSVGVCNYTKVTYFSSVEDLLLLSDKYTLVAADNVEGAQNIEHFVWPINPLIIIGEECGGIPNEVFKYTEHKVYIPQRGSVRSLNAATAAGILMYDFCSKYSF